MSFDPLPASPDPPMPAWFGRRRLRVVVFACLGASLLALPGWTGSYPVMLFRLLVVGCIALAVFGLFERWPKRLPRWAGRWALQVAAVAAVWPVAMALVYALTTAGDPGPWYHNEQRMGGYAMLTMLGLLAAPWIAVTALLHRIRDEAEKQALAFDLARSELERNALDARLRLVQAQVQPHFLFNTLANVRELVDSGSPQAPRVLDALIAYLRAAVPRLRGGNETLGEEIDLAAAYLEIMQMRMPDRLQYSVSVDPELRAVRCPASTVLTLVENAVRHGIDPSEDGGRIDVRVRRERDSCRIEVIDSGIGPAMGVPGTGGLGTGLDALRERLRLVCGERIHVSLTAVQPRGALAEVVLPIGSGA